MHLRHGIEKGTIHPMRVNVFRLGVMLGTVSACALISGAMALAASGETKSSAGVSSITVEQRSPTQTLGKWTMIKPDQTSTRFADPQKTLTDVTPGNYTIFAELPAGMTTTIVQYRGSSIVSTVDTPQISFVINAGDAPRFVITYHLSITGDVAVHSDPLSIPFLISGPNGFTASGTTPESYREMPIGQYRVQFKPMGCPLPRPQSLQLEKDERVNFSITLDKSCKAAEGEQRSVDIGNVVSVTVRGKPIYLKDVPLDAWFAKAVLTVANRGILTGYRDERGEPTGEFGPANSVTVAELAKIAHRLAGIDDQSLTEVPSGSPWYARYILSAWKNLAWTIYADGTIDPVRPATRGEVVVTILQALNVPVRWPKGDLFTDVTRTMSLAGAIETMARDGIISGHSDAEGKPTGLFGPDQPINRAEMAKAVSLSLEKYKWDEASSSSSEQ